MKRVGGKGEGGRELRRWGEGGRKRDRHKRYMRSSKVCANGIPLGETTDSGLKTLLEEMGTKTLF